MSKRKPLIAGNWKLNKNIVETRALASEIVAGLDPDASNLVDAMIIPTFTSLGSAQEIIGDKTVKLGAQDISQYESGAYTGEINAEMLREIGVEWVLVGHSERREIFKEDDLVIKAKLEQALSSGLKVVLCCGESLETREAGKTDEWVAGQINSALEEIESISNLQGDYSSNMAIAYEPIWAIGTGKTCESTEANRVIKLIRETVAKKLGDTQAEQIRILYGGSVKPTTIEEQMAQSDIDGALVGGASLKSQDFLKIILGACPAKV